MNNSKSPLATFAYVIIGLIALIIVFQILSLVLRVITGVIVMVINLALLIAIVYVAYLFIKWATRNAK